MRTGSLATEDGVAIAYNAYEGGFSRVVVLAHGFYNSKDAYLFKKLAEMFSRKYDVLSFDFRGHGQSSGTFSWTSDEDKDLRAVLAHAREKGYERTGLVGFSLGAAIALVEGSRDRSIDSIIAVSSPEDVGKIDYRFWQKEMLGDLLLNIGPKGHQKGVRPGNPFREKIQPIAVVGNIAPTPVLFLHGGRDWLIDARHSRDLFEKAGEPKAIHIVPDAGHAEKIYDDFPTEFEQVCLRWFERTL